MHQLVEDSARSVGDSPALTYKNDTLTYAQLWESVLATARGLRGLGLARGDRVGVFLEKRLETVQTLFGTSAAGGAFVPVNPLLRPPQVAYVLRDCGVRVLVTSADRLDLLRDELSACEQLAHVVVVDAKGAVHASEGAGYTVRRWEDLPVAGRAPVVGIDLDVAAVLYTSGSTGRPKGVVLSHRNLVVGAESVSQYLQHTADDVILSVLPLSFDAGLSQLTTGFRVGAHVVLMNYLLPADVPRMCARHGVTALTCVPPLWIQIADLSWPEEATRSLRYFANTGGRMPKTVLDRLRSVFPQASPYLMYGLTEAFRSTYLDPTEIDRRPDSIGRAIPNAEILVLRPDGTPCDPAEEGELVHRGALVALGYWGDPERTAERFRPLPDPLGTWRVPETVVWSGDTVVADEDGFLYFVGRTDEMIKTSGYRVSPAEVEEVAYDTGLLRDAVALGVPDARLGQHILLVASPPDGSGIDPDELIAAMRRRLPAYMVPQSVVVRDQLPRSPNGKFDRALLRAELAQ